MFSRTNTITNTDKIFINPMTMMAAIGTSDLTNVKKYINSSNVNDILDPLTKFTSMHYALLMGNQAIIDYILSLNPNLELKDKHGDTIYQYALKNNYKIYLDNNKQKKLNDKILQLEYENKELIRKNKFLSETNDFITTNMDNYNNKINKYKEDIESKNIEIYSLKRKYDECNDELIKTKKDLVETESAFNNLLKKSKKN